MDFKNKLAAAGVSVGLLGGGLAGTLLSSPMISGAATDGATATAEGTKPERGAWVKETLAKLVTDGTLTQEQSDKVLAALESNRPERPEGGHHGRGHRARVGLEAASTALGMTNEELRTALRDGKTIAAVAAEKNVDVNTVIDAMVAEAKTRLDKAVENEKLTQEEADEKLAEAKTRITKLVNEGPQRPANADSGAPAGPEAGAPADA